MGLGKIFAGLKTDQDYFEKQKERELAISKTIVALNNDEKLRKIMAVILEDPALCSSFVMMCKTGYKPATIEEKMNKLIKIGVVEEYTECIDETDRIMKENFPEYRFCYCESKYFNRLRLFTPK